MTTVGQVLDVLERFAPAAMAMSGDKVGLQIGTTTTPVTRGLVTFDASLAAFRHAREGGFQLVVSHHPLFWSPMASMAGDGYEVRRVRFAVENRLALIACHTNWDACPGGLNDWLAEMFGLMAVRSVGSRAEPNLFRLVVMVPSESAQGLLDALATAGAGSYMSYERCAYLSEGTGTFRPLPGAAPAIGSIGKVEQVAETRLEMVVNKADVERVTDALIEGHPYEVPDFAMMPIEPTRGQAIARVGDLPNPMSLHELGSLADRLLETRCMVWGDASAAITRIGVCGGAADDQWRDCQAAGAQVLITGEVKQHVALEAAECGFVMIAAGHYATEHPSMELMRTRLSADLPDVEWSLFTPKPGEAGRPL